MVHLHLRTDNVNDITLAQLDTAYSQSYIQFSNLYNYEVFNIGLSNNNILKFFNPNNTDDNGLIYKNNILNVNNVNTRTVKNIDYTSFPIYGENYIISGNSLKTAPFDPSGCFNFDISSYWQSLSIYNGNTGDANQDDNTYKFNNDVYGDRITIKFSYQIIPVGFKISATGANYRDPCGFVIYGSIDNNTWTRLYTIDDIRSLNTTTFLFEYNTSFYKYVTVVITKIVINSSVFINYDYFKLYKLQILSRPILALDNNIKICNNNIYEINKLNAKELFINDTAISSSEQLNEQITSNALIAFKSEFQQNYNIYWKNLNNCGYLDSNVVQRIAINKTFTNSTFDVNGSFTSLYKLITNSFKICNYIIANGIKSGIILDSEYIYIGRIKLNNSTDNTYFNISISSFDIDKYYFQSINIYGYSYIYGSTFFKVYWETSYDTKDVLQRFTDVYYYINYTTTAITYINFYIKFNSDLNVAIYYLYKDLFTNVVFIDDFNTANGFDNSVISFEPPNSLQYYTGTNSNLLYKAINKSSTQLNSNITYLNDLNINRITVNNGFNIYKNNNYINFDATSINNSYNVSFPNNIGNIGDSFIISNINNNTAYLNWSNPLSSVILNPYIKFGDQSVINRSNNIVFHVAGGCLIGSNNISSNDLNDSYLKNNLLVVAGSIYATTDITTDSDISYKYDIKLIDDPLEKINKINGYTFNRNDVNQSDLTNNNRYTGLIAQEVLKIMPEVITKKHDGKLRIIYTNLAGLFVEGIKALNNKIHYINLKSNISLLMTCLCFLYLSFYK
jgi:hypothetical protein